MSLKRLADTGMLLDVAPVEGATPDQIDVPVRIVYPGTFDSIDGKVTVTDEEIALLAANHNALLGKMKRLVGAGEIPVRQFPPTQLDHSKSSVHTVGRVIGDFQVKSFELLDGRTVNGLFGTARLLGRDNVERYRDGRYGNVSIGADFAIGKFFELSITPFPAAEEASLLMSHLAKGEFKVNGVTYVWEYSRSTGNYQISTADGDHIGQAPSIEAARAFIEKESAAGNLSKLSSGGSKLMHPSVAKGLKHHLSGLAHHLGSYLEPADKKEHEKSLAGVVKHLDKGDGKETSPEAHEALKAHFALAAKHMAGLPPKSLVAKAHLEGLTHHLEGLGHHLEAPEGGDKQMAHLKEDVDAMTKCLAGYAEAPAETPKPAQMSAAIQEKIAKLQAAGEKMVATNRKIQLGARLSQIKALRKISPAEIKKIDLDELAKHSDATVDAVFKTYEAREPLILSGVYGDAGAKDLSEVSKQVRMSKMEADARMNMPLKRAELESKQKSVRLAEHGDAGYADAKDKKADKEAEELAADESDTEMAALEKEIDTLMADGKLPEAKEKLGKLKEHLKKKSLAAPSTEKHEDEQKEMSALAGEIKSLQNELNDLTRLTAG